ncbi:multidrug and toxin extrusion protein 1 isoform X1 [Gymnodraco acuticeps]|uniref:Multidrug and toxin extrusion protein n=1 Tax=Gymnodraco acuticeps TaxID=8218 RepID=A0A6P8T238_GYMAC|nr:multidrug and toxin extrusion protein 1 isoform X1 [Gymnodraco acuticeps]
MEKLGSPDPADPPPGAGPVAGVSVGRSSGAEEDEEDEAAVSSKLFRCACVRRWVPLVYREELYQVLRLTGPLLLSRILNFFLPFVNTIFCGHIGNAELAGYALASATINITTTATGYGLALASDTLISQTYGSKNLKGVGVILQRSTLILLLFTLPCWALLINSHNLLIILHQEEQVAKIAQIYVMAYLPAVPAMFVHMLQVAYLQNQGIILPQMYTAAVANIFNLGANYVLIFSLDMGVIGSAIANSISQIAICLLLFGYIRWKKLHQQTWGGWSTDCLQEWGSYMRLAVPSLFMVCFEWWIWDVGGILAGVLGEVDLAAQHVLVEVGAITYMFPLGVHAAACVRVGNALGAGNTTRALVTCKVALFLSGMLALLQGVVIASSKSVVGYIFTSDENIVNMVSQNLTVYIFLQFFDALLCVCSGILVGAGMQKIAALSNMVCYYCVGLPVGIALMFAAKLRILGLWLGIFICVVLEMGFFLFLIFKLNWKKITHKAQLRGGRRVVVSPKRPISTLLNEAMVPDISDCPITELDGEALKSDGYCPVNSKDQELKVFPEAEDNNINAVGAERGAEQSEKTSKDTKTITLLSVTELILRRGLILVISVLILATGVAFHFAFPVPEFSAKNSANFTLNWNNDSTPTPLSPLHQDI